MIRIWAGVGSSMWRALQLDRSLEVIGTPIPKAPPCGRAWSSERGREGNLHLPWLLREESLPHKALWIILTAAT